MAWPPEDRSDQVYTHSTGWVKVGWDTLAKVVEKKRDKPPTKQKTLSKKERRRIRKQERNNRGT